MMPSYKSGRSRPESTTDRPLVARGPVGSESHDRSEHARAVIREKCASGFYDNPMVAELVARRLLDSGDLALR